MKSRNTTIEIDRQTAKALADYAASLGLTIQEYLRKQYGNSTAAEAVQNADQWLDELADGLPDLPPLPSDFSSKDIYAGHD